LFRELTEYFLFLNREFLEQPREWSSYQPRWVPHGNTLCACTYRGVI
jgi:hypothetical protein